jgi:methylthioribose-1-phosphate isomerase
MKKYLLIGLAAALVLAWLIWEIRSRQAHKQRIVALEKEFEALKESTPGSVPFSNVVTNYKDEQPEKGGESTADRE